MSARGGRLSLRAWLVLALTLATLVALPASINLAVQEPSEITFAVIGDFGANDANELSVSNLVKSWNPDFIITVGDNNYPDGEAATIDANIGKYYHEFIYPYAGSYGAGASANRFWPALGNHDWDNLTGAKIQPYLDYFALPGNERYYEFVRGPVHFFVVDSDTREPDGVTSTSVQGQWLQSRLAVSTAPWKIVYFHHPPFSSRTSWTNLQWPFKQWGASAVMAGHAHIYERVLRDGFPYFTNGLGGDSLGSFSTAIEGSMVRFGSDYGAMRVRASSTSITFEFITRSGTVVDTYTMSRNANPPAAPTNLSATTVSTSQIDLAWTDNSTNEDGFQVEQSTDGVNFTRIATVAPNVNAYSNTGLQPAATYYYRVRAFASSETSDYSNTAAATTTMGAPAAPSNLSATTASASQINLSWTDNASNESGFEIERCAGAGCTNFLEVAETGANATGYASGGLSPSTTYRYRVRAFNASGDSAYTNVAEATTAAATSTLPAAPTSLRGSAVSSVQIDLAWTDNSTNEDGFKVYRSTDGVNFTTAATLGANTSTFSNSGRTASTTYYYRVRAFNASGSSAYSDTVTVTTWPPATTKPGAPTGLSATALSGTQIRLNWTDNSTNEDGFRIHRSTDGVNFSEITKAGTNATNHIDSGLTGAQTYYYRVRAYNAAGNSAYTNTVSVRTP